MIATLLTGAAGSGKTQTAIQRVKESIAIDPFRKVWVLMPTELQIGSFRARLLTELGRSVCFGVEYFDFYTLYSHLLRIAKLPQRRVMDTARFRILRVVLGGVQAELEHFGAISQTPGFIKATANFIQELKQARIEPKQFGDAVRTPKDHDLALIYERYQKFLRDNNLVDSEGEGWLALAQLKEQPDLTLEAKLLIVDGYDQFNIVQAELLGLLTQRIDQTILTLTYEPARAATAHRRYAQTRERLLKYCKWKEVKATHPLSHAHISRGEILDHFSRHLFEPGAAVIDNDDSLLMIEAPDPRREVEIVLRRVKIALLGGTPPDSIAIVARDLLAYLPYLLELAPAYGVPIATRGGTPLNENPAIVSILAILDLAAGDFRRRLTMDVLHSPYLCCPSLDKVQIERLEQISRAQRVVHSRDQWLAAIRAAGTLIQDEDGEEAANPITPQIAAELYDALDTFLTRVTPPATASARQYVAWIEGLIGPDVDLDAPPAEGETEPSLIDHADNFQVLRQIREAKAIDAAITARDLSALDCFKRVLLEMLAAYELVDEGTVSWEQFRAELGIAIDSAALSPTREGSRIGRVLVSTVFEARGLAHETIYLLGLSEGVFPARAAEDLLYHDSERLRLENEGKLALITRTEAADETSLFYEVTALARRELVLTRPYSEKGNPWPASPYWRAALAVINTQPVRISMAAVPTLSEAARLTEVVTALAHQLNSPTASDEALGVHRWLSDHPAYAARWNNALIGRAVERQRETEQEQHQENAYTGILRHALTLEAAAAELGAGHVWSASQFNDYGTCPFKFFAQRLLKLQVLAEPEAGMKPTQTGSLLHAILEITYQQVAHARLTITEENQAAALAILESVMNAEFPDAPTRYAFTPGTLWQQEQDTLRQQLRMLIAADFSDASPIAALLEGVRRPFDQEAAFGTRKSMIIDGAAGPVQTQGFIDRMDEADGRLIVIDYKSGNSKFSVEDMVEGRNVQMLLYILAAQYLLESRNLPGQVIGGAFWHIKNRQLSGQVTDQEHALELQTAQASIHERVIAARNGQFPNTPSKSSKGKCAAYCDYSQLCRAKVEA